MMDGMPRQSHIIKQKTGPEDPELQATLQEALQQVSPQDVIAIADELAERHERLFRDLPNNVEALSARFAAIAQAVTYTRKHAHVLIEAFSDGDFSLLEELLYRNDIAAPVRLASFVEKSALPEQRLALELATGLLHNTYPREHWLWTRWLWDPKVGTGILPLLAGGVYNLRADTLSEGYRRVGTVTAMSMKFGEGSGLFVPALTEDPRRAPFAATAFLACAYCVYLYGTTAWRLSREFHSLLPTLPEMARRLVGLRKKSYLQ